MGFRRVGAGTHRPEDSTLGVGGPDGLPQAVRVPGAAGQGQTARLAILKIAADGRQDAPPLLIPKQEPMARARLWGPRPLSTVRDQWAPCAHTRPARPRLPSALGPAPQQQHEVTRVSAHGGREKGLEWAAVTLLETRGFQVWPISRRLTLNWAGPGGATAAQCHASPGSEGAAGQQGLPHARLGGAAGPARGAGRSRGLRGPTPARRVARGLRCPGSGFTLLT